MIEARKAIHVREAIERVLNHTYTSPVESIPLAEASGRILAEDLIASHPIPPFDRSPYDGFALRAEDTTEANLQSPILFEVIDQIAAGEVSKKKVKQNEAIRIMTGALLPDGANAVVMFEETEEYGDKFTLARKLEKLENVSLKGEEVKEGETVLPAGHHINPGTIALLATFGYENIAVSKKPVIAIIATGTELLDVKEALVPGKIRNSNGPMLIAQLERMGLSCKEYGISKDNLESNLEIITEALEDTDCLITTGGVSVGDFDLLPEILKRLEADVLFNKVKMRPGSVTTAAIVNNKYLFALSGNPSACYTGFELFVRPAILKMMGSVDIYLPQTKAVLAEDFLEGNAFDRFVRASYDGTQVKSAGFNKSSAVSSIAKGNVIAVLPAGETGYKKGESVNVLLLGVEEGFREWNV